jgi:hypothetical protein
MPRFGPQKKEVPMEKIDYKKQLKHLYSPSAKNDYAGVRLALLR